MRKFKKGDRVMVEKRDSWPASPGTVVSEERKEYANHYHIDVMRDDGITNKGSLGSSMICDKEWLTLLPEFKHGDPVKLVDYSQHVDHREHTGEIATIISFDIGHEEFDVQLKWAKGMGSWSKLTNLILVSGSKIKQKEKNSMNPTIAEMYGDNTAKEANLVEKHFGDEFDNLDSLQTLLIKKNPKMVLTEAKRLEDEEMKKKNPMIVASVNSSDPSKK